MHDMMRWGLFIAMLVVWLEERLKMAAGSE